jgi:hypothetical protein
MNYELWIMKKPNFQPNFPDKTTSVGREWRNQPPARVAGDVKSEDDVPRGRQHTIFDARNNEVMRFCFMGIARATEVVLLLKLGRNEVASLPRRGGFQACPYHDETTQ